MNALADIAGGKPRLRPLVAGRIRSTAFSWQPILNLPTRETIRTRCVSRGWRSLLLENPS
jgi:hypothetical protein